MAIPALAAFGIQKFMDQRRAQQDAARARQQGAAGILQSSASRLGAPTYNVDAARIESGIAQQQLQRQRGNVSEVVKFMQGQVGNPSGLGASGVETPFDPLSQDYQNNPMRPPGSMTGHEEEEDELDQYRS